MKSRDISILDYFNQLQHEYFCAELRSKIYTNKSDKDYWLTIMEHKRNKINDISVRNKLSSIFNNNSEYQNIFDSVLCFGIPNFVYRDAHQKRKLYNRDLYYYFKPGSDVKFLLENGDITIGKIKNYDLENNVLIIESYKNDFTVNIQKVCRIV